MQCPHCNAVVDDDTIFCGNCGKQITPIQAQGATVSYATQSDGSNQSSLRTEISHPSPMYRSAPTPGQPHQVDTPPLQTPSPQPQSRPGNFGRIALIAAIILVVVAGGTVGLITLLKNNNTPGVVVSHGTGQVTFFDSQNNIGHTDDLKIQISGLQAPP